MNDNDIIKAYKCCTLEACNCTANCPYRGTSGKFTGEECWRKAREDVLDLINRQKAEIERLTLEIKKITETNNALNYQIDTWSPSEAIKEFAKRLKNNIDLYQCIEEYYENAEICYEVRQDWFDEKIDNLVKEMTEEQK